MVEDGRMSVDGGTQQNVGPSGSSGSEGPVSPQAQQLADMMRMIRSVMEKYDNLAVENKDLALEVKLLRSSMACPPQEGAEAKEEVDSYTKEKGLTGFDHKSNPKPDQYGMEQEKFQECDELL